MRELMPPDEPRFAEVAQEMREGGHWVVPHLAGRVYGDKPPVLFWAMNLASLPVGRITATTARIPSALASLAVLLLTARLGRRLFGSAAAGLAAGVVLMTTSEFFQRSQWASTDMTLAALTMSAATCWAEALFGGAEANAGPGHRSWKLRAGWLAAAMATMTKGPVGLFWALAWPAAEAAARGRWRKLAEIFRSSGPLLYVAVVGGWLLASEGITGGGYIRDVRRASPMREHVPQVTSEARHSPSVEVVHGGRLSASNQENDSTALRCCLFLLLEGFVFFSISSGKRGVYLLPAFPALALLVSRAFLNAGGLPGLRRAWRDAPLVFMVCVGLAGAVAAPFASRALPGALASITSFSGLPERTASLVAAWGSMTGGLALAGGSVLALMAGRRGRSRRSLAWFAGGLSILLALAGTVGGALASGHQGARAFGAEIAARVPPGSPIAIERGKFELILFYSGRKGFEFTGEKDLLKALDGKRAGYALIERRTFQRLPADPRLAGLDLLFSGRISDTDYVLLGPAARQAPPAAHSSLPYEPAALRG
ncbi:MAG: hypothetical protein DMF49_07220, partial [Acidobacteria bacterium]